MSVLTLRLFYSFCLFLSILLSFIPTFSFSCLSFLHFHRDFLPPGLLFLSKGHGIKLTLKLTKRSRSSDTHSSVMSGDGGGSDVGQAPPHKKKKRNRSSRESSAHLSGGVGGTPSPSSSSPLRASAASREPVFQDGAIRFSRPPKIDFRVLGMNQRKEWELNRAPRWNLRVPASVSGDRLTWKKSGDQRNASTSSIATGKMKRLGRDEKLDRVSRSCSLFSVL